MTRLSDRVVVVTGAGSGIGRALALLLADKGARLALVDVHQAGLDDTARRVADKKPGIHTSLHVVDVADREAMFALPQQVLDAHGEVDVVVNNAGVTHIGDFADMDIDDFRWVVDVNLMGVVHGCKAFLPHLLQRDAAHIVNVSSLFGIVGVAQQSAYCTSKFAVRGFTSVLWEELKDTNVEVTCVHPAGVATGIVKNARAEDGDAQDGIAEAFEKYAQSPEKAAARIVKAIEKNEARVLLAAGSKTTDRVLRAFPVWGNRLWAKTLGSVLSK